MLSVVPIVGILRKTRIRQEDISIDQRTITTLNATIVVCQGVSQTS